MLVAVLAILPFAGSLGGAFLYDDHLLVEGRPAVQSLARIGELWRSELWVGVAALVNHYYRPIFTTSLAVDWTVWNGNPTGFHATNLVLHGVVTWLVLRALRRWTGSELAAVGGALLWAWHPSKTEAVAWIAGRTDLLCMLGMLVAAEGSARRWRGDRRGIALEVLGTFVAYGSKESAVVLPGLIAVEAWAAAGRPALQRASVVRVLARALPQVAVAAGYVAIRFAAFPISPSAPSGIPRRDALIFTAETIGEIARVVVWPFPLTIERAAIQFDASRHFVHQPGRLAAAAVALGALAALVIVTRKRRPAVAVGLAFAALAFLPVANVVPGRLPYLFADRFAYTPLLGLALAVTPLFSVREARRRAAVIAAGAVVSITSAVACARHAVHLRNDAHLWTYEREIHPDLPGPFHWGCIDAVAENRMHEALAIAAQGYRAASGWYLPQPYHVDFAMHAAHALEELTPDRDRATLERLAGFYATFFARHGVAELETSEGRFQIDAGSTEAMQFRALKDEATTSTAIGARVLARVGDCTSALRVLRPEAPTISISLSRVTAAQVFGRCGAWDEAFDIASQLPPGPPRTELESNLRWSRDALANAPAVGGLDGAMMRSRAATLLDDRKAAYEALVPFREALVADAQGSLFYGRAALAAGYADEARAALAAHHEKAAVDTQIADWTRELGRD